MTSAKENCAVKQKQVNLLANKYKRLQNSPDEISKPKQRRIAMSSVEKEYYEYLMSQDKSTLAIKIMNLETSSSNNRIAEFIKENAQLKQQLHELPMKIAEDFYDEIRHRAILEYDYCPDHNLERKYGIRKCLLEDIRTTILKKYGGER